MAIVTGTSNGWDHGPDHHGIDTATSWWCEAAYRPRHNDAMAEVHAPGLPRQGVVTVFLPADGLDDTESTGSYAIDVTPMLMRLRADCGEREAWGSLKELLSSSGPMSSTSQRAWLRVREWLDEAETAVGSRAEPHALTWSVAASAAMVIMDNTGGWASRRNHTGGW
ncbi:hypothetical protein [Nonomuraea soli]|uniref:Uncharacterized protein n=1 Tax=Nonomuraea soli TaxID=1032476 RepID=A0A7W0CSI7_9ACTN|nr:hypothetical protein [Nonomuraea soli]MBA2896427.1 hypothetical protein [Nonomuraea soli]